MSLIHDLFSSSENPKSIGARFRNQRRKDFEELFFKSFSKNTPIRILDVGGTSQFWESSSLLDLPDLQIITLNLEAVESDHPKILCVKGDATDMPEFKDNSFDLVFSNSVIEHVYTFSNQQKMANEIMRVGKKYFVQTPNIYFPVEAHYALPYAQFWPKGILLKTLTKTKLSRLQKWDEAHAKQYLNEIRLLNEKELKVLFTGSSIYREKVFGLVKSISAHNLG